MTLTTIKKRKNSGWEKVQTIIIIYRVYPFRQIRIISLCLSFCHASHNLYVILKSFSPGTQRLINKLQWQQMVSIQSTVNVLLSHRFIV